MQLTASKEKKIAWNVGVSSKATPLPYHGFASIHFIWLYDCRMQCCVLPKKHVTSSLCNTENKQIIGKLTGEPNNKLLTLQKPRFFIPYQLWLIGTFHQWPLSSNESSFYHGDLSSVWLPSLWKGIILWFIFQATLLQVLEYHVEWLEEIGFSHNQVITN